MGSNNKEKDIYGVRFAFLTDIFGIMSEFAKICGESVYGCCGVCQIERNGHLQAILNKEADIFGYSIQKGGFTTKKISITIFAVNSLKYPLKEKNCRYFSYICRYVNLYLYISLKKLTN